MQHSHHKPLGYRGPLGIAAPGPFAPRSWPPPVPSGHPQGLRAPPLRSWGPRSAPQPSPALPERGGRMSPAPRGRSVLPKPRQPCRVPTLPQGAVASPACSPLFPWGLIPPEGQGGSASCSPPARGLQPACEQLASAAALRQPGPDSGTKPSRAAPKGAPLTGPSQPQGSPHAHPNHARHQGRGTFAVGMLAARIWVSLSCLWVFPLPISLGPRRWQVSPCLAKILPRSCSSTPLSCRCLGTARVTPKALQHLRSWPCCSDGLGTARQEGVRLTPERTEGALGSCRMEAGHQQSCWLLFFIPSRANAHPGSRMRAWQPWLTSSSSYQEHRTSCLGAPWHGTTAGTAPARCSAPRPQAGCLPCTLSP